ncbi:molybdopterin molybdotransferase MoeA [Streptomyces sp. NPDC005438]|uniref:molybdopterin molybdotransferase MoeA n=1 Tax=Streptomyces sp. NPDC005438 TaxID=3156880 RepID=UPI0033A33B55
MNPDDLDQALALANGWGPRPHGWSEGRSPAPPHGSGGGAAPTGGGAASAITDLDWGRARVLARRLGSPAPPVTLPLDEALDQPLATSLPALSDLPSFDSSAMDGWAVSGPGPWQLVGDWVLAGADEGPALADGEAVPIATGARIPAGATAVLRAERGEVDGERLRAFRTPQQGADIRPRGQECRRGESLLAEGTQVTPAVLGLASAAGYDQLTVRPRPRVEVLVLGEELLRRGRPRQGRIRDALGPMLAPWLRRLGAEVLVTRHLGDDREALREAVDTSRADLLLTTGGTAAGPRDHLRPVLDAVDAALLVDGVRVRPGHPMLLAQLPGGVPLVGLPGNPLAAVAGLLTLVEPLLFALAGRPQPPLVAARLARPATGHPRDTVLLPVALDRPGGAPGESGDAWSAEYRAEGGPEERRFAEPLEFAGPAMLRGVASADGLAVVPPGGAEAGGTVYVREVPWRD